jgi:hypothetical protein
MAFAFGGMTFPLVVPANSRSLLEICDPFTFIFLDYWAVCINAYCADAYVQVMGGAAGKVTSRHACQQTTNLDPLPWLKQETFRFPLLSCCPDRGRQQYDKTVRWETQETEYMVTYCLPSMTTEQAERVTPLLHGVRTLLTSRTEACGDPCWRNNANPLAAAGVMGCVFTDARYGLAKEEGSARGFPVIEARILVQEREQPDPSPAQALARFDATTDAGGTEGSGALAIQAQLPVNT